jgi:kynurenine formamidase
MRHRSRTAGVALASLLVACVTAAATGQRPAFVRDDYFRWMKQLSNWGRWGSTDQRGTLNLITADKMKQAAQLVKTGISVSLAELQIPNEPDRVYTGEPYRMTMHLQEWEKASKEDFSSPPAEDLAISAHGGRSHIDSPAHMFYKGQGYNGLTTHDITEKGALKASVEQMRHGIVTRGVLVDLPQLKGVPYLNPDVVVGVADLENWEKRAHVTLSAGDALFVRTGQWARRKATGDQNSRGSAGFDPSIIPWLKKRDVAVLGSESASLEASPSQHNLGPLPVHWFATAFLGIPVIDYLDLDELSEVAAQQRRWEFLVTIAPLPIRGGTGSPVNPIAVF